MIEAHKHLIKWGISRGYTIEIEDEGEMDYSGTEYAKAVEAAEAIETGNIYLCKDGEYDAGFRYILQWDQNPDEIVSDWGINKVSKAWDEDYTRHCKKYPINKHFSRSNN
jgi:hypothetical protein